MTITEFKLLLSDSELGSPNTQVLLLFNEYTGPINRIDAIAIRITEENLLQLQQATNLIITVPASGELVNIPVENSIAPLRTIDKSIEFSYYVYYIIQEDQRPIIAAPTIGPTGYESYTTQLTIPPGVYQDSYEFSNYNPLIGNATDSRESEYRFRSDRTKSTINPANLAGILSKTATPATVQDSNYTNTGWVNSRYGGTKLTAANNTGIEPSVQGAFFEAALFPYSSVDEDIITLAGNGSVPFNEYFFTGKGDFPQYGKKTTEWVWDTVYLANDADSSALSVTSYYFSFLRTDFKVGDILSIINPSNVGYYTSESLVRVVPPTLEESDPNVYPYILYVPAQPVLPYAAIQIEDRYNGTPTVYRSIGGPPPQLTISRISPTKIYRTVGTTIQGITRGKMVVKGVDEVLYIDSYGQVVGGTNPVVL